MTDYLFHGDPDLIGTTVFDSATDPDTQAVTLQAKSGFNIIGPITLDGIGYANVRTDSVLTIPDGLTITTPQLSTAILGDWAVVPVDVPAPDPIDDPTPAPIDEGSDTPTT